MPLPNAERAEVDLRKLADYCLSPQHPVGKHKAAVFLAAQGLTAADAGLLRDHLLEAALTSETFADQIDEFGDHYRIESEIVTPRGRASLRSAWIIRKGEDFARLTTCFVIPK